MTLLLIASQDYILIPYQKDGKWGLADIIGIPVLTDTELSIHQGYLISHAPVKSEFSPTHLRWISTEFFYILQKQKSEKK
ncbi:hypothetical protein LM594_02470 [Candidatus Caldipriscus sp.]|nr:hypothetical protein [Candidatus Caldipriscus sp.]